MIEPHYCLDSNICIYLFAASVPALKIRIEACASGTLAISSIVLAELMVGTQRRGIAAQAEIGRLLEIAAVLPFDSAAARSYGALPFKRTRFDRLVAAHALALDLTLVTANIADFADIPGLRVEDWTQS